LGVVGRDEKAIKKNTTGSIKGPKERILNFFYTIKYDKTIAQLKKLRDSYILVTGINLA